MAMVVSAMVVSVRGKWYWQSDMFLLSLAASGSKLFLIFLFRSSIFVDLIIYMYDHFFF
jgi:hypothetical protein